MSMSASSAFSLVETGEELEEGKIAGRLPSSLQRDIFLELSKMKSKEGNNVSYSTLRKFLCLSC